MAETYKLSSVLYGHKSDVRALAVTHEGCIVSASRDKTAKYWKPNGLNAGFTDSTTFLGHANFVSSVCVLPPYEQHPSGLIITGGNDARICIFEPTNVEPLSVVTAHNNAVCCLTPSIVEDVFLSTSWDCTGKVWKVDSKQPIVTLTGHEAAVWSVIQLPTAKLVTGSADKTIRVWTSEGKCLHTLTGHTDCVRGLVAASSVEFLSCANDAVVRYWNADTGTCIASLYGHTNYIYSIAAINQESFVTSGEDKTIRIWKRENCVQTINIPAQSVWCVAVLPNKDIVAGSSDGLIRIFTKDTDRVAEPEVLHKFDEEVAKTMSKSETELGGVKINELPGSEVLKTPGKRDGQTKIVREPSGVACYSWSAARGEWTRIGDVMGASGGDRQLCNGKEYDYVFSIDVEEGKPPLKLPYNRGDDPWTAAQKFIHEHNLSQLYLDQIANFIISNSTPSLSSQMSTEYADPFTGGNRYVPTDTTTTSSGGGRDPFTGSSSYVPQGQTANETASKSACTVVPYFPQKTYLKFDQANVIVIVEKLQEFNRMMSEDVHRLQAESLDKVVNITDPDIVPEPQNLDTLKQLLEWPEGYIFPVLDIARLAIRNPHVNKALCAGHLGDQLIAFLRRFLIPDSLPANQMLALRLISNMLSHPDGEVLVLKHSDYLLSVLLDLKPPYNRNVQIAAVTVLLNLAVAFSQPGQSNSDRIEQALKIGGMLLPRLDDPEAQFRCLVAVGTLLWESDTSKKSSLLSQTPIFKEFVERLASSEGQSKVANCAAQIAALLEI